MRKRIWAAAFAVGLAAGASSASAGVYTLDNFEVIKGTSVIHNDPFSDNIAPPDSSGASPGITCTSTPNCYAVSSGPGGVTESSGRAVLDTALGTSTTGPTGSPALGEFVTLLTATSTPLANGLRNNGSSNTNFSVTGIWDLIAPADGERYGIRLTDRQVDPTTGNVTKAGDDVLELAVRTTGGITSVDFDQLDFVNNTLTVLASTILSALDLGGNSQISLTLNRASSANNDITASFTLLTSLITTTFNTAGNADATVFNGEDWTRGQFFAVDLTVPEPASLALFGLGLAGVGFVRRRKAA